MLLSIKVYDGEGTTLAVSRGEDEVNLAYAGTYQEGDHIVVELEQYPAYVWLQVDDALGRSLVYVTGSIEYIVPFEEKRKNRSKKAFVGGMHLLSARKAYEFELSSYRNLAYNVNDQHDAVNVYPHAIANVETRGEMVFAAENAIDGVTANDCHGDWPYASWGINRREDATLRIEFGREVYINRIMLYERADYPHDTYWVSGQVSFSDGSTEVLSLKKTKYAQEIVFEERCCSWIELHDLVKSEESSPFPALTQIEVYGVDGK